MLDASWIYLANGVVRWACERAYWPLFITMLVTDVGLSPLQLVLLGTFYEASIFLSEIPTGVVADLYSRRLSVIISYLVGGVAAFLSAFVSEYWLLVLSQVLIGFGATFESGAETAWITDEVGDVAKVEPLILRRSQIQFVAATGGLAAFGLVAYWVSLRVAVAATGLTMFMWGVSLFRTMAETGFVRSQGHGWRDFVDMMTRGLDLVRSTSALRILGAVVMVAGVAKEAIDRLDIQRLDDVGFPAGLSEATIVVVLVITRLLIAAGLLAVVRRRVSGRAVVPAMAVMFATVALGVAVLAHANLLWLAAIGMIAQGGFHNATQPLVVLWTNTFAPSQARATVHSFMGQGESIGEVVGGIALGIIAEVLTVPTAMTISAVLFGAVALLTTTARRQWTAGR